MSEEEFANPLDDLFKAVRRDSGSVSKELFIASEMPELRSDLVYPEDVLISVIKFNDLLLENKGLKPQFTSYIADLLKVRFSLERKSREEFVKVNTRPLSNLQFPADSSNFKSIGDVRK